MLPLIAAFQGFLIYVVSLCAVTIASEQLQQRDDLDELPDDSCKAPEESVPESPSSTSLRVVSNSLAEGGALDKHIEHIAGRAVDNIKSNSEVGKQLQSVDDATCKKIATELLRATLEELLREAKAFSDTTRSEGEREIECPNATAVRDFVKDHGITMDTTLREIATKLSGTATPTKAALPEALPKGGGENGQPATELDGTKVSPATHVHCVYP